MEFFRLNNGVMLPALGSGTNTFGRDNSDLRSPNVGNYSAMTAALKNGFRFFDCAISYGNEDGIGQCLAESGIAREDLFILNKIPNRSPYNCGPESIRKSVSESMKRMHTDYFDLYLIHQAVDYNSPDGKMNTPVTVALYKELEQLYHEGKFRAIGVANFDSKQLEILMGCTDIVPACNQIRCNPALRNQETLGFCKVHGIVPMAHSPMNFAVVSSLTPDLEKKASYSAIASKIGERYGKGWGQVLLRQNYQLGICSIPKTHSPEHQLKNLEIFDFELTAEEMEALK